MVIIFRVIMLHKQQKGKEYDLLAVGNKLWEYKEADNA